MRYAIRLTRDDNDTWLATSPKFPELTTFGRDPEDALARARRAARRRHCPVHGPSSSHSTAGRSDRRAHHDATADRRGQGRPVCGLAREPFEQRRLGVSKLTVNLLIDRHVPLESRKSSWRSRRSGNGFRWPCAAAATAVEPRYLKAKRCGDHPRGVNRHAAGTVGDLVPTGDAVGDDHGVGRGSARRR